MNITELIYPDFVANQVLTSAHLNDLREYLDEQTRLTRANLIGVGIACGLEVDFDGSGSITLSRGVGVTTQGYLIVEPADVTLVSARPYTLPTDPGYGPLVDTSQDPRVQFDLWELFPDDDVPGAVPLPAVDGDLASKAVVLFLELDRAEALTCSPVDCDDRGPTVTATQRRLLVEVADLDKIISAGEANAPVHMDLDMADRLNLPDLRMPRVDVPATGVTASEEVLHAFQQTFRANKLATAMANALTALHKAFHPLLADDHPLDPFASFAKLYGFLDQMPTSTRQVLFLQYYWDFFDDLLAAYDEVRWAGVDLMCVGCPPEGWFPRHLMAGVLSPAKLDPARYRHRFLRSPAVGDCVERTKRFRALFTRLVRMAASFTNQPETAGIRATPSRWGQAPLSDKAIPYYYGVKGTPPFHHLWDPTKTARGRANHNLGYRATEYVPQAPAFVSTPLRFELEPNNFLRIEGHLGVGVRDVLKTLLELRTSHRLPFEVVALRTGVFDENTPVDVDDEDCRFEDIQTLYQVLHAEWQCMLRKQVRYFYDLPDGATANEDPIEVSEPLLVRGEDRLVVKPGTLGHVVETGLARRIAHTTSRFTVTAGTQDAPAAVYDMVAGLSELHTTVPEQIASFEPEAASGPLRRVLAAADQIRDLQTRGDFTAPGLTDHLDEFSADCHMAQMNALAAERARRIRKVKQAQYLGHFLGKHPGIQHKAGVPLGGTFVLVHHAPPPQSPNQPRISPGEPVGRVTEGADGPRLSDREAKRSKQIFELLERMRDDDDLQGNSVVRELYKTVTGMEPEIRRKPSTVTDKIYEEAVASLPDGAVIADFFLPYCCCSDCTPIQFTLPTPRLDVTARVECTNADGYAAVVLTAPGASGSLSVQVDGGPFRETTGTLPLPTGDHALVVRDAAGNESRSLRVIVPPPLVITQSSTQVDGDIYQVTFTIQGGTAPYAADPGTVEGNEYASDRIPTGEVLEVKVADARGCGVAATFEAQEVPCDLPCDGSAIRGSHRFWLPEAQSGLPLNNYDAKLEAFDLFLPDGSRLDLAEAVNNIIARTPNTDDNGGSRPITGANFASVVGRWLEEINALVAEHVGSDQWFRLDYETGESPWGALFTDRLACLEYRFVLTVRFVQGRKAHEFSFEYTVDGTVVVDHMNQGKAFLPLMGGHTSNKCRPQEPPEPRCKDTDLELWFDKEVSLPEATFHAGYSGGEVPVAFLWEIQDGSPSLSGEQQVSVRFDPMEPVDKRVRLTAFTANGCTVVVEETINLRDWG